MIKRTIAALLFTVTGYIAFSQSLPAPDGLLCNLLRDPSEAVITDSVPEFGWIFPQKGIFQAAFRVLVASSPKLLEEEKADFWDSRKTETSESANIAYSGKALAPNSSYWWKVKVWGKNGESAYSLPQKFNTGRFSRSGDEWPGQSNWVLLPDSSRVAEDRQKSTFSLNEPVLFKETQNNTWFADFGKSAFGTLEFTATSEAGDDSAKIFLGERSAGNFSVDKNTGVSNIGFYAGSVALKKGTNTYTFELPRHNAKYPHSQKTPAFWPEVMPFRYAEIIAEGKSRIKKMSRLSLFYYFDDTASDFLCSDENLNKVWDLCKYTLKATPFLGVYCDGNRERMPYEADAFIQQLGHYSVDREFSVARYTIEFLLYHASWPTEWQMHAVMMAYEHYMHTGDTRLIAAYYNDLKLKTLTGLEREDGLISTKTGKVTPEFLKSIHLNEIKDIVDWPHGTPAGAKRARNAGANPEGETDGYVFTEYNTVVNAFHAYSLECMSKIAQALGKTDDSNFFKNKAETVKSSILQNMFDNERGIFIDGVGTGHASLHANLFPLAFNLVPEKDIKTVVDFIKSRGMACSVYGAQYLLEALYNAGEAEYALSLMVSDSKRSWINMLNAGSTMTTEAWDESFKPNLSWTHAWGAAPANIIPRRMMGIQPVEPGYRSFTVNPQPDGLSQVDLKVPTIRGEIAVRLNTSENRWQMALSVPGNSKALLLIPSGLGHVVVNGKVATPDSEVRYLNFSRNLYILEAGNYTILAEGKK